MPSAKRDNINQVEIWGTGRAKREFLHVQDCAQGIIHLLKHYSDADHVNLGTGEEFDIRALAELIKRVVGFDGELFFDSTKPDGTPRKLLDVSKIHDLGWTHDISLDDGLISTYEWFLQNGAS